jgi:phosphoglycerol transferase MdoB-like AlkP superfamily enzyme
VNLPGGERGLIVRPFPIRYLAAWVPAGGTALYLQHRLLTAGGYAIVARQLGQPDLSLWQRFALYRADLALAILVIPAVLLFVLRLLGPRWRAAISTAVGLMVVLIAFIQLRAFDASGAFVSLFFVGKGLSWAGEQAGFASQYVAPSHFAGLALLVAATLAGAVWAARGDRAKAESGQGRPRWWLAPAAMAGVVLFPWLVPLPRTSCQGSALAHAVATLAVRGPSGDENVLDATPVLKAEYRSLTQSPVSQKDPAFFGRARGADLIYFVLETTPARVLPIDGDLGDLPNLARLRSQALVLPRHFATYPYTSFALFSILTGIYPSDRLGPLARPFEGYAISGTMSALAATGYRTALYAPTPQRFAGDSAMWASLGIQEQHAPEKAGPPAASEWEARRLRDQAAFDLLLHDLSGWIATGQRYAAVFLPQLGHAPWPDISPDQSVGDPIRRARALARQQDRWLGDLIRLLEESGRLQSTLIVVVGDHGIRTHQEDPGYRGGKIDDYSFHVPALIYAPQALRQPLVVSGVTSHIDLQSSVLDLLGVDEDRALEQGTPVWDEGLRERTTFLFGRYYIGADGFVRGDEAYMWNYARQAAYRSPLLAFPDNSVLDVNGSEARSTAVTLARAAGLQERWWDALRTAGTARPPTDAARSRSGGSPGEAGDRSAGDRRSAAPGP